MSEEQTPKVYKTIQEGLLDIAKNQKLKMTNETQLLQELQKLEELEKSKSPVEKAYKVVYGGFPITDGTGNEFDELAWNAFYHGYCAEKGSDD